MLDVLSPDRPAPRRLLVIAAVTLTCLLVNWVIVSGSTSDLIILLIPLLAALFAFVPVWITLLIYFGFTEIAPLLKYVSHYNTIVHLGVDILLAAVLLRWLAGLVTGSAVLPRDLPLRRTLAVFLALAIVMMFSPLTNPLFALGGIKSYILPMALYPLIYAEFRQRRRVRVFLVLAVAWGVMGAAQLLFFAGLGPQKVAALNSGLAQAALEPGQMYFGAGGTVGWHPLAVISSPLGAMVTAILLAAIATGGPRGLIRRTALRGVIIPCLIALLTSIIISGERLAAASTACGLLVLCLVRGRRALLLAALVAGTLVVGLQYAGALTHGSATGRLQTLADPTAAFSSSGRSSALSNLAAFVLHQPLGQGMGRTVPGIAAVAQATGISLTSVAEDNMLTDMQIELGDAGLVLLCLIAVGFLARAYQVYRRLKDPELRALALGCLAALVGLIATWLAGPTLEGGPPTIYFWGLAGLAAVLPAIEASTAQATAPSPADARPLALDLDVVPR